MGRPKKPNSKRKRHIVRARFDDGEIAIIKTGRQLAGLTATAFVRDAILGKARRAIRAEMGNT